MMGKNIVAEGQTKIEMSEDMLNHGLGYEVRALIPRIDIESNESETKEVLWDIVLRLREEARKLNLRWKYVSIAMQIRQERGHHWRAHSDKEEEK